MSVPGAIVAAMTDELSEADNLFYTIASLKGWDEPFYDARDPYSGSRHSVGRLMSALLLATDDATTVVAAGGELDDAGAGYLALITRTGLIHVDATPVTNESARYVVESRAFTEIDRIEVMAEHNYFAGVDATHDRHARMSIKVTSGGTVATFKPSAQRVTFANSASILEALKVLQAARR